jgi:hypothetical protein
MTITQQQTHGEYQKTAPIVYGEKFITVLSRQLITYFFFCIYIFTNLTFQPLIFI